MTIEQVAKKIGVSNGAVSGWENGTHGMTPKHLKKFSRLLGIHPIELSKIIEPDAPTIHTPAGSSVAAK